MFNKNDDFGFIVGVKEEYNVLKNSKYEVKMAYGSEKAKKAAKILCSKVKCVVSFGFAGSVDSELKNGGIIVPKFIIDKSKKKKYLSSKYRLQILDKLSNQKVNEKGIISVDEIINEKKKKEKIFEKFKASSVDMESDSIYKICFNQKIPFVILRVIFDDLSFNIPDFIIRNTNSEGDVSINGLLKFILINPEKIFILFKVFVFYLRAKKKLKEILKECF